MKAITIDSYGGVEKLQLVDIAVPPIKADQVLVKVKAAAVNPIDWRIRSGMLASFVECQFPVVLGREVAGVVAELGDQVTDFAVGDEVYGFLQQPEMKWGSYAEYVPADAHKLALKPKALSFEQAVAVPVALHTAQQALFQHAGLQAGQTVLIHGAGGGVGVMAVQLAHLAGARVLATASPSNHAFIKTLGADLVVDYREPDFAADLLAAAPNGVDVILAPFAGHSLQASEPLVHAGTRIVLLSPVPQPEDLKIGPVESQLMVAVADGAALRELGEQLESGQIKVEIAAVFPLAEAAAAHEMSEAEHARGKIVIKVSD